MHTENGKKETADILITGKNKVTWLRSLSNKQRILAQSNNAGFKGTDTTNFIFQHKVPANKDITYTTFIYDYQLFK